MQALFIAPLTLKQLYANNVTFPETIATFNTLKKFFVVNLGSETAVSVTKAPHVTVVKRGG